MVQFDFRAVLVPCLCNLWTRLGARRYTLIVSTITSDCTTQGMDFRCGDGIRRYRTTAELHGPESQEYESITPFAVQLVLQLKYCRRTVCIPDKLATDRITNVKQCQNTPNSAPLDDTRPNSNTQGTNSTECIN